MSTEAEWIEGNRAFWDERVPLHVKSSFYGAEEFKAGSDPLASRPFELEEMGDVAGKSLLHLQCHFGLDTLAWARRGARVVGLDFSERAVEAARLLADELKLAAQFVLSDVYDAVPTLSGRQFDIVYTGRGALVWLPNIPRWAEVVAALVRPGGYFYLSEFHPFHEIFGEEDLVARHDYGHTEPRILHAPGSYATSAATQHNTTYEWAHGIGTVVTALIDAGLRFDFLHEFDYTGWNRWPFLEETEEGIFRMPTGMPSIPLAYSLKATKPA